MAAKEAVMLTDYTVIADVFARIAILFARLPMLDGFSVQERTTLTMDRDAGLLAGELCIADVSIDAWADRRAIPVVNDEIAQLLRDLLEERPESYEVLRGHTFARTFH
jgi:hypothetical protein